MRTFDGSFNSKEDAFAARRALRNKQRELIEAEERAVEEKEQNRLREEI